MPQRNDTAENSPVISRDRAIDAIRKILRAAIILQKSVNIDDLAEESGVSVRAIRSYMTNDPAEQREPPLSVALSLVAIIGNRAVNSLNGLIGYVAHPIEDGVAHGPAQDAAEALRHVSNFVSCAIDNHIDHLERPIAEDAADNVIELMAPYSTKGRAV